MADPFAVLQKNLTPRYRWIDRLEAYVEGRQYAGLAPWFADGVPLLDRAPCIVEPIAENAIESFVDLCLGEGRFPCITSHVDESDDLFDPRFGLSETDSEELDRAIQHIAKQANLEQTARDAMAWALGERSVAAIICVRDGKLAIDNEHAKSAEPTFDPQRPTVVTKLEIRFPYIDTYWNDAEKKWKQRCLLYRRVIDDKFDTVYKPIEAHESGEEPGPGEWTPETQTEHGFTFCPVVWYAHRKTVATDRGFDGVSLHERQLDEIDALNRTLSQKHRAGLYCGDPQPIETGVAEDVNPAPMGQAAQGMKPYADASGRVLEDPATREQNQRWQTAGGGPAGRKRGPGVIWRYPNPATKVEYLVLPPEALKVLEDEASALRGIIANAFSWVRSDPASMGEGSHRQVSLSNISGKALAWMYKRQTTACDTLRPDFWNGWLLPVVNMLLRAALSFATDKSRGELYLPGLAKFPTLLARFEQDVAKGNDQAGKPVTVKQWFSPVLSPQWGPYFPPTEEDQKRVSDQTKQDHDSGFITKRTAVGKLAEFYGDIDNVDEYVKTLEDEAQKKSDDEHAKQLEVQKQLGETLKDGGSKSGARSGNGAKPEPVGRSGGAVGAVA
jgi:hypothetical protein